MVFFASFVSFVDQNLPSAARPVPTRPRRRAKTLSASLRSAGFLSSLSSLSSLFLRLASLGGFALVTLVALVAFLRLVSLGGSPDGEGAVGTGAATRRFTPG